MEKQPILRYIFFTVALIVITLFFFYSIPSGRSTPVGVNATNNISSSYSPAAATRTDAGGTITTLDLDTQQTDDGWKGYVGNVTGKFTLDDSDGYSIYDWSFTVTTGEVYIARASSPNWSGAECAGTTKIDNEEAYFQMLDSEYDEISDTFNETIHQNFRVGVVNITNSTCYSTFVYVNDSRYPTINESTPFQEVLIQTNGTTDDLVYVAILETDEAGYHDGYTYDFQSIVPDSRNFSVTTTYYFWAELGY